MSYIKYLSKIGRVVWFMYLTILNIKNRLYNMFRYIIKLTFWIIFAFILFV